MTTRAREVCRELLEELKHGAALQAHLANDPVLSESMRQLYARVAGINHDRASALSALIAECEWLPIATAPKDGTPFLAAYDPKLRVFPVTMWVTWWAKRVEGLSDGYGRRLRIADFTHWRPLPAPPPPTPELITGEVGEEKGETK